MPKDIRFEQANMILSGTNLSTQRLTEVFDGLYQDGKMTEEMYAIFAAFKTSRQWLVEWSYVAMMAEADAHTTQEMQAAKDRK